MPDDLAALSGRIADLDARMAAGEAALRRAFEERTGRAYGLAWRRGDADLVAELRAATPDPAGEARDVAEAATDAWLEGDDDARGVLRAVYDGAPRARRSLFGVAGRAHHAIGGAGTPSEDAGLVRRALAAFALEGGQTDPRDTIMALDSLYLDALMAGLAAADLFAEAAPYERLIAAYLAPDRQEAMALTAARRRRRSPTG